MIQKAAHIIISGCLSLLLLFGGTAKEFIHLFAGHEDTTHCSDNHEGLSFENEHHHCDFLSFALPFFDNDIFIPGLDFIEEKYFSFYAALNSSPIQRAEKHTALRGPPVLFSLAA